MLNFTAQTGNFQTFYEFPQIISTISHYIFLFHAKKSDSQLAAEKVAEAEAAQKAAEAAKKEAEEG